MQKKKGKWCYLTPEFVILALTGACNFKCRYCYAANQALVKLPHAAIRWALDMAAANGKAVTVQLTGGEPLLAFDRLCYAVEYAAEKNYHIKWQIQTNASLITPAVAEYFAKHKIGIGVSLDGDVTRNNAARIYPDDTGTAHHIMRGLSILRDAGLGVGITCVVGRHNIRHLDSLIPMAYYAGNVFRIGFDILRPQGRASVSDTVTGDEMQAALVKVLQKADWFYRKTGKKITFSHSERIRLLIDGKLAPFGHCHALTNRALYVDPSGDCYACASLSGQPEFRLGSYKEEIQTECLQTVHERLEEMLEKCRECDCLKVCGGGCYARWVKSKQAQEAECVLKKIFIHREQKDIIHKGVVV